METKTIDRLFLELSQFTDAETAKELRLKRRIYELEAALRLVLDDATGVIENGEKRIWPIRSSHYMRIRSLLDESV